MESMAMECGKISAQGLILRLTKNCAHYINTLLKQTRNELMPADKPSYCEMPRIAPSNVSESKWREFVFVIEHNGMQRGAA